MRISIFFRNIHTLRIRSFIRCSVTAPLTRSGLMSETAHWASDAKTKLKWKLVQRANQYATLSPGYSFVSATDVFYTTVQYISIRIFNGKRLVLWEKSFWWQKNPEGYCKIFAVTLSRQNEASVLGMAVSPMMAVGLICLTTSSRRSIGACFCANGSFCPDTPPAGRSCSHVEQVCL